MDLETLQKSQKSFKAKAKAATKAGKSLLAKAFKNRADHLLRKVKAATPKTGDKKAESTT